MSRRVPQPQGSLIPIVSGHFEVEGPFCRTGGKKMADAHVRDRHLGRHVGAGADGSHRDARRFPRGRGVRGREVTGEAARGRVTGAAWTVAVRAPASALPLAVGAGAPLGDLIAVLAVVARHAREHGIGQGRGVRPSRAQNRDEADGGPERAPPTEQWALTRFPAGSSWNSRTHDEDVGAKGRRSPEKT
jgi:hypothetical protein